MTKVIAKTLNPKPKFNTPELQGVLKIFITDLLDLQLNDLWGQTLYWCEFIENLIRNHGERTAIVRLKVIRLHVTRYLCGDPLFVNTANVKVDRSGIPSCLRDLKPLVDSKDPKKLQFLMTLLVLSRAIEGGHGLPDLSPITDPAPLEDWEKWRDEIKLGLRELNIKPESQPVWTKFHPSTKKGPNGQAIATSVNDAHALKDDSELMEAILTLGGNTQLRTIIKINQVLTLETWSALGNKTGTNLRKLSSVNDPEGKVRLIAIFDYWSQTVLLPLHDRLMEILKGLPGDRTYCQTEGFIGIPTDSYWSLDLTNATDRFPLGFQKIVMEEIFGKQYSEAWATVMVSRPFSNPWGEPVLYKTGQPMGAYSSWAAFTLCHHVLVQIATKRSGLILKDQYYQILGDDIVIANDSVSQQYQKLLSRLGVGLSLSKTHNSKHMYEFAKRWYWNGKEVSGLPVKGVLTVKNHWWHLLPELQELVNRCSKPDTFLAPGIFSKFLILTSTPLRFARRLYITKLLLSDNKTSGCREGRLALRSWLFTRVVSCNVSDDKYLKAIHEHLVTVLALRLEESLVALRKTRAEYLKTITPLMAQTGIANDPLLTFQVAVAPLALITQSYKDATNRIQGLKESAYTMTEIIELAEATLMLDPTSLLHERKKFLRARSQVDLSKKIILLTRQSDFIRNRVLSCSDDEVSDLFILQQNTLPSWKKERVSWSHIMHQESLRIQRELNTSEDV